MIFLHPPDPLGLTSTLARPWLVQSVLTRQNSFQQTSWDRWHYKELWRELQLPIRLLRDRWRIVWKPATCRGSRNTWVAYNMTSIDLDLRLLRNFCQHHTLKCRQSCFHLLGDFFGNSVPKCPVTLFRLQYGWTVQQRRILGDWRIATLRSHQWTVNNSVDRKGVSI